MMPRVRRGGYGRGGATAAPEGPVDHLVEVVKGVLDLLARAGRAPRKAVVQDHPDVEPQPLSRLGTQQNTLISGAALVEAGATRLSG